MPVFVGREHIELVPLPLSFSALKFVLRNDGTSLKGEAVASSSRITFEVKQQKNETWTPLAPELGPVGELRIITRVVESYKLVIGHGMQSVYIAFIFSDYFACIILYFLNWGFIFL